MLTNNQNQTSSSSLIPAQNQRRRAEDEILLLLQEYRRSRAPGLRDRIVMQYANLVESVARRFSGTAEPVEDLAQEGYIGLITAIDLYDASKNVKFSTYATHFIIGQIKHYLRDRGKIIKEPAWLQELNQRMTRTMDSLAQQLSRPATNQEIAQVMGMTEEAVAEMLMTREVFKVSSIDGGSDHDDDNAGALDMERQKATDISITFQLPVEDRIVLEAAMQKLKELEQRVVTLFYFKHLNQTEIAKQLSISCNYVSHILRNSTKKLKKILVTEELRDTQRKMALMRKRSDDPQAAEQAVIVDSLTRLYNRCYFEMRLAEEISWTSRENGELSVLFVRISGLENFQHSQGTIKADEAVVGMVQMIRDQVRRSDILTRYSTDTFALILPHTGQNAYLVEERLRRVLQEWLQKTGWDRGAAPLTLSLGAAIYPQEEASSVPLSALAQQRMALLSPCWSLPQAA